MSAMMPNNMPNSNPTDPSSPRPIHAGGRKDSGPEPSSRGLMGNVLGMARGLVSKKKKRFVSAENDLDLDLTYITERVIAMGFPATGKEALYRNPLPDVQRFLEIYHPGDKCKVYNLCSEREYESIKCFANWGWFPFDDHNPCAFEIMHTMMLDIDRWLEADPKNVVAIHCKAGKGRTGMVISTYLLHSKLYPEHNTAAGAMRFYGEQRTSNAKGVTIPSQIRWVHYYERYIRMGGLEHNPLFTAPPPPGVEPVYKPKTLAIRHVRLVTVPQFDPAIFGGGCDPYLCVNMMVEDAEKRSTAEAEGKGPHVGCTCYKTVKVYNQKSVQSKVQKCHPHEKYADLDIGYDEALCVRGNVQLTLKDFDEVGGDEKMCSFWFNTAFVDYNYLVLDKFCIDSACKDKAHRLFSNDFKVEVYFEQVSDDCFDPARLAETESGIGWEPDRFTQVNEMGENDDDEGAVSDVSEDEAMVGTIRSDSNANSAESVAMGEQAARSAAAAELSKEAKSMSIDEGRSTDSSAAESGRKSMFGRAIQGASSVRKSVAFRGFKGV